MDQKERISKKVVIIGGGAVGMAVATSLTRHSDHSVTVFSADRHTAYSQCGMPFAIGGQIKDLGSLILRDNEFLRSMGIDLRLESRVDSIDLMARTVESKGQVLNFDKLVIATGSKHNFIKLFSAVRTADNIWRLRAGYLFTRKSNKPACPCIF